MKAQNITTAKGTQLPVSWLGVSDLDGSLRFEVTEGELKELFSLFSDPEETAELTHRYDEKEIVYRGFTRFKGIERLPAGSTVIRLLPGSAIPAEALREKEAEDEKR